MGLGTLRYEVLEVRDEVVEDKVILKSTRIKQGCRIGVVMVKEEDEEVGLSLN